MIVCVFSTNIYAYIARKVSFLYDEKCFFKDCPEPVPLAVVVGAIVGSIVTLGLIILALLKGIIMFIQWREYKKFVENMASQQWGQVSFLHFGHKRDKPASSNS